jgi:ketosteroid isomerase-like protein
LTETPADIVSALQKRWISAFNQRDVEGLVALYSEESCLFGGKPDLSINRPGIRKYFIALPPGHLRAEFGEQTAVRLAPTVIMSAGFMTFAWVKSGSARGADAFPYNL